MKIYKFRLVDDSVFGIRLVCDFLTRNEVIADVDANLCLVVYWSYTYELLLVVLHEATAVNNLGKIVRITA